MPYDTVLPGHRQPGGKGIYDEMLRYLAFSKTALAKSADGGELKARLVRESLITAAWRC